MSAELLERGKWGEEEEERKERERVAYNHSSRRRRAMTVGPATRDVPQSKLLSISCSSGHREAGKRGKFDNDGEEKRRRRPPASPPPR